VTVLCFLTGFQNPGHIKWELGEACDFLLRSAAAVKLHETRRVARPSVTTSQSDPDLLDRFSYQMECFAFTACPSGRTSLVFRTLH